MGASAWALDLALTKLLAKIAVVANASVPAARPCYLHQLAEAALAGLILLQQAPHLCPPCSGSFSYDGLQHVLVQAQIGNQPLQPSVLVPQVLYLFSLQRSNHLRLRVLTPCHNLPLSFVYILVTIGRITGVRSSRWFTHSNL